MGPRYSSPKLGPLSGMHPAMSANPPHHKQGFCFPHPGVYHGHLEGAWRLTALQPPAPVLEPLMVTEGSWRGDVCAGLHTHVQGLAFQSLLTCPASSGRLSPLNPWT